VTAAITAARAGHSVALTERNLTFANAARQPVQGTG